nr:VWA domain-containing protein [Nocardia shimofusensis]
MTAVDAPVKTVGDNQFSQTTAQGEYLLVHVSVTDIGDRPQTHFGRTTRLDVLRRGESRPTLTASVGGRVANRQTPTGAECHADDPRILFGAYRIANAPGGGPLSDFTIPLNEANPDPRVACIVLADVSGSMSGAPIAALQEGFAAFVEYVTEDDLARKRAEVAVITFGTQAQVAVPLQEARMLEPIQFSAGGSTNMAAAIDMAIDMIDERKREYKAGGIQYYRPWLLLLTDGAPNPMGFDAAVARLNALEAAKGVTVFAIGVGDNVDYRQLERVTTQRPPAPLAGLQFNEFFEWLSASLGNMASSGNHGRSDQQVAANSDQQVALAPLSGWTTV